MSPFVSSLISQVFGQKRCPKGELTVHDLSYIKFHSLDMTWHFMYCNCVPFCKTSL